MVTWSNGYRKRGGIPISFALLFRPLSISFSHPSNTLSVTLFTKYLYGVMLLPYLLSDVHLLYVVCITYVQGLPSSNLWFRRCGLIFVWNPSIIHGACLAHLSAHSSSEEAQSDWKHNLQVHIKVSADHHHLLYIYVYNGCICIMTFVHISLYKHSAKTLRLIKA